MIQADLQKRGMILDFVAKNRQVIHGTRALNRQLPVHLRRETSDYDIFTDNPKTKAQELAMKLNKRFGQNQFAVVPGKHKKTFKVKSKEGKTVADFTSTTKKPGSVNVLGVRYAKLDHLERRTKKILKDPTSAFRHEKDLDTLDRIKKSKKTLQWLKNR